MGEPPDLGAGGPGLHNGEQGTLLYAGELVQRPAAPKVILWSPHLHPIVSPPPSISSFIKHKIYHFFLFLSVKSLKQWLYSQYMQVCPSIRQSMVTNRSCSAFCVLSTRLSMSQCFINNLSGNGQKERCFPIPLPAGKSVTHESSYWQKVISNSFPWIDNISFPLYLFCEIQISYNWVINVRTV